MNSVLALEEGIFPQFPLSDQRSKVAIIYCGGTVGMMVNSSGALEPAKGYLQSQLSEMPEISDSRMPQYQLKEYDPLLDSSDMVPSDWVRIATDIETLYPEVDGFVILMGTDTMAYCASALSFMLQNLAKPVVVTGGAVPLCEVYNDSRRNLIVSMLFACSTQLCEVCIFFNDVLLRGNRTTKHSHTLMHAFRSPNYPPLATLSTCTFKNPDFRYDLLLPPPRGRLLVHKRLESRIYVFSLVFSVSIEVFESTLKVKTNAPAAIILLLPGLGQKDNTVLDRFLLTAKEQDILVVFKSQCQKGSLAWHKTPLVNHLMSLGATHCNDMTLEAIVTKLAYLFGCGLALTAVKAALHSPLRGEVSPEIEVGSQFAKL